MQIVLTTNEIKKKTKIQTKTKEDVNDKRESAFGNLFLELKRLTLKWGFFLMYFSLSFSIICLSIDLSIYRSAH